MKGYLGTSTRSNGKIRVKFFLLSSIVYSAFVTIAANTMLLILT